MEKIIKVTAKYVPNILEHKGRVGVELTYPYIGLTSIYDLLHDIKGGIIPEIQKDPLKGHKVIVNGKVIDKKEWKVTPLHDKDEIVITPEVEDVITMAVIGGIIGGIVGYLTPGLTVLNGILWGFSIGGALGGILFPPLLDLDMGKDTPTYSWNGQRSYVSPEDPLPIAYGQLPIPLRIVNSYITNDLQYDRKWVSTIPTITYSELVDTFIVSNTTGIKLYLKPRITYAQSSSYYTYRAAKAEQVGHSLKPKTLSVQQIQKLKYVSTNVNIDLKNDDYYFLPYRVEYKKTTDSEWTDFGWYVPNFNNWKTKHARIFIYDSSMYDEASKITPLSIQFTDGDDYSDYNIRITLAGENVDDLPSETGVLFVETLQLFATDSEMSKSYLSVLGVLGEGEFDQIDPSMIEIDGNPISNYDSSTFQIYTRLGKSDQSVIPGFSETHTYQNLTYNLNVQGANATQTTIGSAVEGFIVTIVFNGLYRQQDDGDIKSSTATYRVEWKLHSASTWDNSMDINVSAKQQSQFTKQFRKDQLPAGQYDIRVTRVSGTPDFQHISNMTWTILDEFIYADIQYPHTALVGMKILATDRLSGMMPTITVNPRGRKVLQPKIVDADGTELAYDDYYYDTVEETYKAFRSETLLSESNSHESTLDTSYVLKKTITIPLASFTDPYYTIHFSAPTYPAEIEDTKIEVYVDATLKATHTHSVLNADIEGTVAALGAGTNVYFKLYLKSKDGIDTAHNENFCVTQQASSSLATWDGTTWVTKWTANPVWIMYDLLRTNRPGISDFVSGEIYTENLEDEARYCDTLIPVEQGGSMFEKRFRLDACIDSENRAADLLQTLAASFRAYVYTYGGQVKIAIDREGDVVQKFTMGNIRTENGKSTFKSAFASLKSTPNIIEVQYYNNGERDVVLFEDQDSLAAGDPIRKKSVNLIMGITRTSQALRMAKYYLYLAKYCVRSASFGASLEAITASAGDVISVQHDVTGWGFGGRCATGSNTTTVKLDGSVTLAAGTNYELIIQFADDTIERKDISSPAGTYTQVAVSSAFSQSPAKYDKWEIVTKTLGEKKFKVIDISRDGREDVSITGLEYNASIYDDITGIVSPTPNYSLLQLNAPITDLSLSEGSAVQKDGTVENTINASFTKPVNAINYGYANIYLSDDDGDSWEYRGQTNGTYYTIVGGITAGTTYTVAVASVSKFGEELTKDKWATAEITIIGKYTAPEDITGFKVSQSYDKLILSWNPVSDKDLDYYEIRRGSSWSNGTIIDRTKKITDELLSFPFGYQGYYIKARDTSGNYSETAAFASITVTTIPGKIPILSISDDTLNGTVGAGLDIEYNDLRDVGKFEKCVLITTQRVWDEDSKTWDEVESEGIRFDYPVEAGGYYTMAVQDIGFIATVFISPDLDIEAEGDEATHTIEERHSDDNISWSGWSELTSLAVSGRYVQFRVKLQTTNEEVNIRLFSFGVNINLPEITEYQSNVAIANTGTTVNFVKDFHTDALGIIVTVIGNPYIPYITDITKDSVKVYLYDGTGNVSGTVNIVITGI